MRLKLPSLAQHFRFKEPVLNTPRPSRSYLRALLAPWPFLLLFSVLFPLLILSTLLIFPSLEIVSGENHPNHLITQQIEAIKP